MPSRVLTQLVVINSTKKNLESCSQSSRLTSAAAAAAAAAPNPTGMLPAAVVSMHLPSHLLCVACQSLCLFQCTSVQLKVF